MSQKKDQIRQQLTDLGPFGTARDAAAASTWARSHRPAGAMTRMNLEDLEAACAAAGLELTSFERHMLEWFASFEPASTMVLASLITRAAGSQR